MILHPGLISKSVLRHRFHQLKGKAVPLRKNFEMPLQEYTINNLLSISPMHYKSSLVAELVKHPPAMQETWV